MGGIPGWQTVAIFGSAWLVCMLSGWLAWWRRKLRIRGWRDGSVDPESKQQRWHEDTEAVLFLVFIAAVELGAAILALILWRLEAGS